MLTADELDIEWPLVGRSDVTERFRTMLATSADRLPGAPTGLALVGPAGVGKTRLALECQAIATAQGWRAARIIGSRAASSVPFGAAAGLLVGSGHGDDPVTLIRRSHEALTNGGKLCLVADDVELLDGASATLVLQTASSPNVIVVVTARQERVASSLLTSFWRQGSVARIDLPDLGYDDVRELASHVLGGPLDDSSAAWLHATSGGNPMFVRELVIGSVAEHGPRRTTAGTVQLVPPRGASVRLTQAVEDRMGALDERERWCLEAVAIAEPVSAAVIEGMGFAAESARLERRQILAAALHDREVLLSVAHPLYGEIARAGLLPLRDRSLRRSLAQALEALPRRSPGDAVRIATWYADAGAPNSAENLLMASREAFAADDIDAAERFARAAHGTAPSVTTAIAVATPLFARRDGAACEAVLASAAPWPATDGERSELVALRATNLLWLLDDEPGARGVLEQALGEMHDADARARLVDLAAQIHAWCHLDDVAAIVADAPAPLGALALVATGAFDAAFALLQRERDTAADVTALDGLEAFLRVEGGWVGDGVRLAQRVIAHTPGSPTLANGWALLALASAQCADGDGGSALQTVLHAARNFDRLRDPLPFSLGTSLAAFASLLMGDSDRARHFVGRAPRHAAELIFDERLDRARAAVAVADGDVDGAAAMLRCRAARAAGHQQPLIEQICLYDLVRLDVATERELARVAELDGKIRSPASSFRRRHAESVQDGRALSDLAAAVEADGMAYWACELAVAALHRLHDDGDDRTRASQRRRIARLRAGFPHAIFLRSLDWLTPEAPLELRESERAIALLAASGLTDREIATRVHLSVRTVSNYLLRIYRRLGITGRDELAAALRSTA